MQKKIAFIHVLNEGSPNSHYNSYARIDLQSTFQLMGCKPQDAHQIAKMIFKWINQAEETSHKEKINEQNLSDEEINEINEINENLENSEDSEESEEEKDDVNDYEADGSSSEPEKDEGSDKEQEETKGRKKMIQKAIISRGKKLKKTKSNSKSGNLKEMKNALQDLPKLQINTQTQKAKLLLDDISESSKKNLDFFEKGSPFANFTVEMIKCHKQKPDPLENELNKLLMKFFQKNSQEAVTSTRVGTSPLYNRSIDDLFQTNDKTEGIRRLPFVILKRSEFDDLVRLGLAIFGYKKPFRIQDFKIATEVQERKRNVILLFGGTSGCGKSTLASLVATRLGITKVLSTDSIRHMLRSYLSKSECPVLYASTYHAGECLTEEEGEGLSGEEKVIKGYRKQCNVVISQLDKIIKYYDSRNEPLVVEGVHLLTDYCLQLMQKHSSVIPYVVYISNKEKHKERFAIRAKYMTLEPRDNKYVKYYENIRIIQDYLCNEAMESRIPTIDNTNVDRSLSTIHYSVFKSLKKTALKQKSLYDPVKHQAEIPCSKKPPYPWSSKKMLKMIQKKKEEAKQKESLSLEPLLDFFENSEKEEETVEEENADSDNVSILSSED